MRELVVPRTQELVVPRSQGACAGVTEEDKGRESWGRLMTAKYCLS